MKRFLAIFVAISMMIVGSPVYAETMTFAEEILKKSAEAWKDANGVTIDVDLNLDMEMILGSEDNSTSVGLKLGGGADVQYRKDPLGVNMDVNINVDALGQSQEVAMGLFIKDNNDGTYLFAAKDQGKDWTARLLEEGDSNVDGLKNLDFLVNLNSLQKVGADISVEEEDPDYKVKVILLGTQLVDLVKKFQGGLSKATDGELDLVDSKEMSILSLCDCIAVYTIDKESYQVKNVENTIIVNDPLAFSALTMGTTDVETTVVIRNFKINVNFDYNDNIEIFEPDDLDEDIVIEEESEDYEEAGSGEFTEEEVGIESAEIEYWKSSILSEEAYPLGTEENPAYIGDEGIGYFYDSNTDKYYQCLIKVTGVEANIEADEAYEVESANGYDLGLTDDTEPRIVYMDVILPEDIPEDYGDWDGHLIYLVGFSIVSPDKGYLDYGDDGYFYVNNVDLTPWDLTARAGDTVSLKQLIVMPKDLTSGYRIEVGPVDKEFYVDIK